MNNFKLKSPKIIEKKKLEKFFRDNGLSDLILLSKNNEKKVNEMKINKLEIELG